MTVSLHWNGGPGIGAVKLRFGTRRGSKTGGYGKPSDTTVPYDVRNPAYDTAENGGGIEELRANDGTPLASKYGRLYSSFEAVTGQPNGALNKAYQIAFALRRAGCRAGRCDRNRRHDRKHPYGDARCGGRRCEGRGRASVLKMQTGDLSLWLAYRQPSGLERSDLGRSAGFEGFAVRNRRVVGQL